MDKKITTDYLKLKNQLCFPLYAASREVIKLYKPYLDELDLTWKIPSEQGLIVPYLEMLSRDLMERDS